MTRRITAALGLGLALALNLTALAQNPKEAGGANAVEELDLRVQFDKESAKGEIKCKNGKLKDGKVEFEKCLQDKLDKYDDIAVLKKIISKEKLAKLDAKKKRLAKKLAFFHSARKELKGKLAEMGEAKKDDIEYKKAEGALKKIDKEFDKSLAECAKEDKADFACPSKD